MIAVFYIPQIPYNYAISAGIFAFSAFTDFLDGYIARKYNQITDFGKLVDPLADKLLVLSALLIFVENGIMPVWVATVIIGREFAISGLRMIAASKGIVIAAGKSGKVKTFVQCLMTILLLVLGTKVVALTSWLSLQNLAVYLMVIVAVYSGVEYFVVNGKIFKGSLK